jgi:hypothetical protein
MVDLTRVFALPIFKAWQPSVSRPLGLATPDSLEPAGNLSIRVLGFGLQLQTENRPKIQVHGKKRLTLRPAGHILVKF